MKWLDIRESIKPVAISLFLGLSVLSYKNTLAQTLSDDAKVYTSYNNRIVPIDDSIDRLLSSDYKYIDLLSTYWHTKNEYECRHCYADLLGPILANDRISTQSKIVLMTVILWGNDLSTDQQTLMMNDIEKYDAVFLKVLIKRLSLNKTLSEQEKTLAEQEELIKSLESFERLFNSYLNK